VKVLIILEDQTHDRYIAKPIVETLCEEVGIKGRMDVLTKPRLRGASDALNPEMIRRIVADNPMVDIFIFVVDRDCDRQGNVAKAKAREDEHAGKLIACLAEQEIEVWMLALYKDKIDDPWNNVRSECDPKERWAERFGTGGPGGGRKNAMRALTGQFKTLLRLCPELSILKQSLEKFKESRS
jgi:hypothetical protein